MMERITRVALATGFAVALLAPDAGLAQEEAAETPPCLRARELATPEERQAHRDRMAAHTEGSEEQSAARASWVEEMRKRAAEQGKPLCRDVRPPE